MELRKFLYIKVSGGAGYAYNRSNGRCGIRIQVKDIIEYREDYLYVDDNKINERIKFIIDNRIYKGSEVDWNKINMGNLFINSENYSYGEWMVKRLLE